MTPQRRPNRKTHLDASAVPVERSLLARAEAIEAIVIERTVSGNAIDLITMTAYRVMIDQFRELAEELHWW